MQIPRAVGLGVAGLGLAVLAMAAGCANDATAPDAVATAVSHADTGSGTPTPPNCMRTATGAVVCAAGNSSTRANGWELVSVGGDHTCALQATGAAYCWGSNRDGQLGAGSSTSCGAPSYACSTAPLKAMPGTRFVSISAGARHSCGITTDGAPVCWGANDFGQAAPPALAGAGWVQISAGYSHTCAVRGDGAVFCWGANANGELGDGSQGTVGGPVRVALPAAAASVSAGQERTCARTVSNAVYCWGAAWTDRQNGWEMTAPQPTPAPVEGAPAMSTISVGTFTTCGSDAAGAAYCWEANPRGEIGNGTQDGSVMPLRVATSLQLFHLSSGMLQTCGVTLTGAGYCWGDDTFGELGVAPSSLNERCDRQSVACSTVPVAVSGGNSFTQISTGLGSHTCGVTTGGDILCWGLGVSGQRGDGSSTYTVSTPALVVAPRTP